MLGVCYWCRAHSLRLVINIDINSRSLAGLIQCIERFRIYWSVSTDLLPVCHDDYYILQILRTLYMLVIYSAKFSIYIKKDIIHQCTLFLGSPFLKLNKKGTYNIYTFALTICQITLASIFPMEKVACQMIICKIEYFNNPIWFPIIQP